ncbi:phage protein NinX family protein [Burkholderia gladioli]|uniref:phage protein NinX family protein n=1 Tax=Burkholderia gladioli TaxID=28095 RepID=UPI0016417FE1|nr:phage protein NinX family protein [Burkholderia gladioli]
MKVAELTGALLDYWVAKAQGIEPYADKLPDGATYFRYWLVDLPDEPATIVGMIPAPPKGAVRYSPSSLWEQGGSIIERGRIDLKAPPNMDAPDEHVDWAASIPDPGVGYTREYFGETPLIAAMRAYVASKFGDDVVPKNI